MSFNLSHRTQTILALITLLLCELGLDHTLSYIWNLISITILNFHFYVSNEGKAFWKCLCFHIVLRYQKAIEIFEEIARHSLSVNLLKYGVKGHLLNAGICQLCKGDVVAITNALEKYQVLLVLLQIQFHACLMIYMVKILDFVFLSVGFGSNIFWNTRIQIASSKWQLPITICIIFYISFILVFSRHR